MAVIMFLAKQGELYNKDEALLQTWLPESARTPPHNPWHKSYAFGLKQFPFSMESLLLWPNLPSVLQKESLYSDFLWGTAAVIINNKIFTEK